MERQKPTLMDLQERAFKFSEGRPTMRNQDTPTNLLRKLNHEEGELWREINRRYPSREAIGKELADIGLFLLTLANQYGLDLGQFIEDKLDFNEQRFPASLFQYDSGLSFKEAYEMAKEAEKKSHSS